MIRAIPHLEQRSAEWFAVRQGRPTASDATEPTRDGSCFNGSAEELARYLETLRQCLAPLRQAREGLKHPENIERVGKFASTLNAAFAELKGGKQ